MEDDLSKAKKKRGSGTIEQNAFVSISHAHYYSAGEIHFGIEDDDDDVHRFGMNVARPGVVAVTTTIPKKPPTPNTHSITILKFT